MTLMLKIIDIQQDDPTKNFASMATAIAKIMESKGRCTPSDLFKRFRPMEVLRNWTSACGLALSLVQKERKQAEKEHG